MTAEELIDFKNLFDILDEDGSEFIDRNELKRALKKLGELISDEDVDFFMSIIDGEEGPDQNLAEKDGQIDFKEFLTLMTRIDPNQIDADEREQLMAGKLDEEQKNNPKIKKHIEKVKNISQLLFDQAIKDNSGSKNDMIYDLQLLEFAVRVTGTKKIGRFKLKHKDQTFGEIKEKVADFFGL